MTEQFERVAAVEASHWWFVTLREHVAAELRASLPVGARVLDAGCGTGRMLGELPGYARTGVDVNPRVLEYARSRHPEVEWIEASVSALPFPERSFDALISLDVLYATEVEDDLAGARELRRVLRPGGPAIFHLPAYQWLMSGHDVVAKSARRYTARGTRALLREAGFSSARTSYRVSALFPVAATRRLLTRGSEATDVGPVPSSLNRALTAINRAESQLIRRGVRAPFGLSVLAVAKR